MKSARSAAVYPSWSRTSSPAPFTARIWQHCRGRSMRRRAGSLQRPRTLQRGCEDSSQPPEGDRIPALGPAPTTPLIHFPAPPLSGRPDLQFSVLSSVMQWGPAPQILRDLCAVQQEPAEHFGVAATGSEVHGRGAVMVLLRKANVCKAHLQGGAWQRAGLRWSRLRAPPTPSAVPPCGPQLTSHTRTGLWPICAAACSGVMPSWARRCGSALHSCTRYFVTSRWPSWHARYRGVAPLLVWAFTPLQIGNTQCGL